MKLGLFHFQVLYTILENIHYIYDEHQLSEVVLDNISHALNAEGGTIFRLSDDGNVLEPLAAYGASTDDLKRHSFQKGRGVVGWVAQYNQPVKVDNPRGDPRFMGSIDTATGFNTRSIVAAPIVAKGRCIGVIEFLNRRDGPFAIPDEELISLVGHEIGIAFENARLVSELKYVRDIEEAVSVGVLNSLSAGLLVVDQNGKIIKINTSAADILKLGPAEALLNKPVDSVLKKYPRLLAAVAAVEASAECISRKEASVDIDGTAHVIGYSGCPFMIHGTRRGSLMFFQDITAYVNK